MRTNPNIEMMERVAEGLGDLLKNFCFIGGATTSLYLDRPIEEVRPTQDVDCVVGISTYIEQQNLERKLESIGFQHCTDKGAPICRWVYKGVLVDVMPSNASVLGFKNEWFADGMRNGVEVVLPSGTKISIFSIPYFLAAKLAAFKDRGRSDFYASSDWEDIVTVVDGRVNVRKDIFDAPKEVKEFLRKEFESFSGNESFLQSILGHLAHTSGPQERALRVFDVLLNIA